MVCALPTREVTQAVLDEELSKLATAAFPNQAQELYQTHYIRAARGMVRKLLMDNDKVIVEVCEKLLCFTYTVYSIYLYLCFLLPKK